ncbi:hypothetical protein DKL61_07110 [Gammaproteobacteria bacterium ESL0073]|nr:hypothetical protein DKL61_07055 [Gammaproteobacteria bacterium ESL0073]AWM80144.1 hypothetical protein DKL61_07110 [Gammaproteobacteria bacterium ESL0073]
MKKLTSFFILLASFSGYSLADGAYCTTSVGWYSCASSKEAACQKFAADKVKQGFTTAKYEKIQVVGDSTYCVAGIVPEPSIRYFDCDNGGTPLGGGGINCSKPSEPEPEPVKCEVGNIIALRSPNAPIIWVSGSKQPVIGTAAPDYACVKSCEYTRFHDKFSQKCFLVPGSTDTGFCNFGMSGTGKSCETETPSNGDPETGDPLPTTPPNNCEGEGCNVEKPEEPENPDPPKEPEPEPEPEPKPDPPDNPSGGGGTGGNGSENGGSGGGGSSGGGTAGGAENGGGSGSGSEGEGNGNEGNGNGNGNGSGNGNGNCDPSKEECGEGEGGASGLACDQPLTCDGDAIQCAQLEKQKEIKCAQEELYKLDDEQRRLLKELVGVNTQEIDGFGDKEAPVVDVSKMINKGSSWLSRSCPAPITIDVKGQSLQFSYTPICDLASWFSGVIIAIASFLAIRVFVNGG